MKHLPTKQQDFAEKLSYCLSDIEQMLLAKNQAYGNSALDPVRIFSKASSIEQLFVRIDDKLSRIQKGDSSFNNEDVITDLIGYLILYKIATFK